MSQAAPDADAGAGALLDRVRKARRDPTLVVLEGLHPLKHALRFGAEVLDCVTADAAALARLARVVAPDVAARVEALARPVAPELAAALAGRAPAHEVLAIANRPAFDLDGILRDQRPAPIVALEDPRSLGNMGACVRVAAAAGAAALVSTGANDPWHPDAVRGGAGLQFALPVGRVDAFAAGGSRPLVALDPSGEPLDVHALPSRALLVFGGERHGLSEELLASVDACVRIPMRAGVSSLNLATSVAAVLFSWRLRGDAGEGDPQAM